MSATEHRFSADGLGRSLRLGDTGEAALFRAGQPLSRPGRSYRYCVGHAAGAGVAGVFNGAGRLALITGTVRGDKADGIGVGATTGRLKRRATRRASGLWVGRRLAHGARYVYIVRGNRVGTVALAAAGELRSISRLRADLRLA